MNSLRLFLKRRITSILGNEKMKVMKIKTEDEYTIILQQLLELNSAMPFENGKAEHAAAIIRLFLQKAEMNISIFCNSLDRRVYGERSVQDAAKKCIQRGVSLRIICQKRPDKDIESFYEKLLAGASDVSSLQIGEGKLESFKENFSVADSKMYRYEPDRSRCKAVACLNDPEAAKILQNSFEDIRNSLDPSRHDLPSFV